MQYRELTDEELKSVIGGIAVSSYASNTSIGPNSTKTTSSYSAFSGFNPTSTSFTASSTNTDLGSSKSLLKGKLISLPSISTL
jgi:bacteriocin-like protein